MSHDENGETKLHLAAFNNQPEECHQILEEARELGILHDLIEDTYYSTPTALWIASKDGHPRIVKLLLEYGAIVDKEDSRGTTPLMIASKGQVAEHIDIVNLLLKHNASVKVKDEEGKTALDYARDCRKYEWRNMILEALQQAEEG